MNVNRLSYGRSIRALEGRFTQRDMFALSRQRFNPKIEGIAKVEDLHDAHVKKLFDGLDFRTDEYRVYRHPGQPLGSEISWMEDGVIYRHLVLDVPVQFEGREISLQRAAGMGVYDSISLLKIEQTDANVFTVSVVDPSSLAGRVRAADFKAEGHTEMWDRNEWAYGHAELEGRPGNKSGIEDGTTGYHGSISRALMCFATGYSFYNVFPRWSEALRVAIVDNRAPPSDNSAPPDQIAWHDPWPVSGH